MGTFDTTCKFRKVINLCGNRMTSFLICILRIRGGVYLSLITQTDSFCIYENKKSVVNEYVHNTLSMKLNLYCKLLRTTISPVGCKLPSSGSTEIPSESNEPISASEVT